MASALFPITVTNVESPDFFNGREVPGPSMSAEAKSFAKMCEELNHCMADQRSPLNRAMSGVTPNEAESDEVFLARRLEDKKWYRVVVINITRRCQGPEALCDFVDFGDQQRVPLAALRKLPERFKKFPFQLKRFGLFGLQPQTLVTCPEDMTSSYQLCAEWDLSAATYMRKVLAEARDVRSEIIGITEDHVRWIRIHLEHIDGNCLNDILVNNGYACQTKTKKDYDFKDIEPFVPSPTVHTKARLPKFAAPFSHERAKGPVVHKHTSDAELSHSEYEGDSKTTHSKRSHSKRKPLVPRVKDGACSAPEHDSHSETRQREIHKEAADRDSKTLSSPESVSTKTKATVAVSLSIKLGRGGYLCPNRSVIPAVPNTVQQAIDITSGGNRNEDLNSALKSPPRGIQPLDDVKSQVFSSPLQFGRGASPGRGFLLTGIKQPGGLREKCDKTPENTNILTAEQTESVPMSADSSSMLLDIIKSPPRKQMKPHLPAKAKLSPARPNRSSANTDEDAKSEMKTLSIMAPAAMSPVRDVSSPKEDNTPTVSQSSRGRGFLHAAARGLVKTPNEPKPHGLREKSKSLSPPKETKSAEVASEPSSATPATRQDANDINEDVATVGRASHRRSLQGGGERKPHGLWKPVIIHEQQSDGPNTENISDEPTVKSPSLSTTDPTKATPTSTDKMNATPNLQERATVPLKPDFTLHSSISASASTENTPSGSLKEAPVRSPAPLGRGCLPGWLQKAADVAPSVRDKAASVGDKTASVGDKTTSVGDKATVGDKAVSVRDTAASVGDKANPASDIVNISRTGQIASLLKPESELNTLKTSQKTSLPKPQVQEVPNSKESRPYPTSAVTVGGGRGTMLLKLLASPKVGSQVQSGDESKKRENTRKLPKENYQKNDQLGKGDKSSSTPEKKMQGVGQKSLTSPIGLGRARGFILLRKDGESPEKSIKHDIFTSLLDKSSAKIVPPMPTKLVHTGCIYDVSDIEDADRLETSNNRSRKSVKKLDKEDWDRHGSSNVVKKNILGQLIEKSSTKGLTLMPTKTDRAVLDVDDLESAEAIPPLEMNCITLEKPEVSKHANLSTQRDRKSMEQNDLAATRTLNDPKGGEDANADHSFLGQLRERSKSYGLPPMPAKTDTVVLNAGDLEGTESVPPLEASGVNLDKNVGKSTSLHTERSNKFMKHTDFVPAQRRSDHKGGGDAKENGRTKHVHKLVRKVKGHKVDGSSEDEIVSIMKEARVKGEKRSMCSPDHTRTDSSTPKEIEDVEKLLGSHFSWQPSGSGDDTCVPSLSSYMSYLPNQRGDGKEAGRSGSPIRSAAEMAWYSADAIDGEEVVGDAMKNTNSIGDKIDHTQDEMNVTHAEKNVPNDDENGALDSVDGNATSSDNKEELSHKDTEDKPTNSKELDAVNDKVKPVIPEDTVVNSAKGETIPESQIYHASEVESSKRHTTPEPESFSTSFIRSRTSSSSDSFAMDANIPDSTAALLSATQTLVAVASPNIANSCLFNQSSSVDPDDYVVKKVDQLEDEPTEVGEVPQKLLQPFFSDSDSDMPELEADDKQESGTDTQVRLSESKDEFFVEDMPELEQHMEAITNMDDSQIQSTLVPDTEKSMSVDVKKDKVITQTDQNSSEHMPAILDFRTECKADDLDTTKDVKNIDVSQSRENLSASSEEMATNVTSVKETVASSVENQLSTDDETSKAPKSQYLLQGQTEAQDLSSDTSGSTKPTTQGLRNRLPKCATTKKLKPSKLIASSSQSEKEDAKDSKPASEMKSDNRRTHRSRSVTFSDDEVVLNKPERGREATISDDDEDDEEEKALLKEIQERAIRQQQLRLRETFAQGGTKKITGFANFEYFEKEEEIEDTLEKGVFLDGKCTLTTCTRINDSNLHESMRVVYTDHQIMSMTTLQSYVWPALNRGLSMVVISQRYTPANTLASEVKNVIRLTKDVTTAYLPPMISKYLYEGIPEGPGPLGVILCSSWRRVEWVLDQCRSYCAHVRIRTEALYGSCGEDAMEVRLLNGCEVLVATPNSLLRMLDKMIFDFKRVMHLVFDDGEVLTEQFREPLTSIMSLYYTAVDNRESREPSQLILCGQHWTPAMDDFMTKCIPQPQIVIQAKLEAAIYADTRFVVEMCASQSQLQHLTSFVLDPSINVTTKTLVCCRDLQTANLIAEGLTAQTHHVLLALEISLPSELEKVREVWKTSGQNAEHKPILVASDAVLAELQIDDVERVIHFDLPNKAAFMARLWTMRANYAKLAMKIKNAGVEAAEAKPMMRCQSISIITEDDILYAPAVLELLRRVQAKVPRYLDALALKARKEKEEFSTVPLCQHMCAFGVCRLGRQCLGRHVINADIDAKTPSHSIKLPKKGYATIKVMHVVDANFFWARLVHHHDHGVDVPYNLDFGKMTFMINSLLSFQAARKPILHPSRGDIIAVEDIQHTWHRAKILSLGNYNKEGFVEDAVVFMVDIGEVREIRLQCACHLPDKCDILQVPYQAFRVFVADVKPFDNDLEWTRQASLAVANSIGGKEMNGRIVLTLGDTMWLVNLHEQKQLKFTVQSETVSMFLIWNKLAVKNQRHIPLLYSACEGKIDLPEVFKVSTSPGVGYDLYQRPVNFETKKLNPTAKEQKIVIPVVESPDLFYVQMDAAEKLIMDLHFDIQDHLRLGDIEATTNSLVKAGSLVLARMPSAENPEDDDVKWYRCKARNVTEDDQFEVFYLDFGDIHTIPKDKVRPLPLRFLQPAFQAVECQLAGIKPLGDTWTDEAVDGMFSIIWNEQNETKVLDVKVVGSGKSTTAGLIKYKVELTDDTNGFPVDVAMEMVTRGYAAPTKLFLQNLLFTNDQDNIRELVNFCRQLIVATDAEQQKETINTIHDCCAAIIAEEQDLRLHEVLTHLGKMLGYVPDAGKIMGHFAEILDMLLPEQMNETLMPGIQAIILNLFRILRRIDDYEGKCDAIISLIKLAAHDSCQSYMRSQCNGLMFLTKMLYSNMEGDLALVLVKLLYCLLPTSLSYIKGVIDSRAIDVICLCLLSANDEQLIGWCCMALQHPAAHERWNAEIRKAKVGPKLCNALMDIQDGETLMRIMTLLEIMCETNRITTEYFQECGLRERLRTLNSKPYREKKIKNSVENLLLLTQLEEEDLIIDTDLKSLKPFVISRKEMLNTAIETPQSMRVLPPPVVPEKITEPEERILSRQAPPVKWTQDKYNIVLRVEVHDVKQQKPVTINDNMVIFRAVVLGIEYCFNFPLYELIIPKDCEIEILNSAVNIGLRKRTKGTWPRLLKQKTVKPTYLSVDFDHSLTTDSDSDSCDDENQSKPPLLPPLCLIKKRRFVRVLPPPEESSLIKRSDFSNIIPSIPEFDYQPAEDSSDSSVAVIEKEYDEFNIFDVKNN